MQWIGVHIITRLELGGAQLATLYEAAHSTFTAAPRYLIYGPGGLLDAEAQALPHVVCLPAAALGRAISARRDVAAIWQVAGLLRQIRRRHPGAKLLVHTHSSKAGIIGRLAAAAVRAECVVHSIHGFGHQPAVMPWITWRGLWLGEVLAARCTQGFTADSAANLARGRAEGIITHHKTQVVHCGIDVAAFAHAATPPQEVRVRLGIEPDHLVVLQVACLKPQKNPLALLELAAALRERFPKVIYLLAGDGELRGALQEARRRLGLEAQVQFLGWRRDVPDLRKPWLQASPSSPPRWMALRRRLFRVAPACWCRRAMAQPWPRRWRRCCAMGCGVPNLAPPGSARQRPFLARSWSRRWMIFMPRSHPIDVLDVFNVYSILSGGAPRA
jgi:glycosyltransferase involved in cell wall biosynthesis